MKEIRVEKQVLKSFCVDTFIACGLRKSDAHTCSDVLISADMRGIRSHGVDALKRYISGIKEGIIIPKNSPEIVQDRKSSIVIDAKGGMGMVAGNLIIDTLLEKAKSHGIAMGTVRESNHFGFGAYYAMKAARQGLIGLVLSNTASIAVPTNATIPMIGSNPISFAAPSNLKTDFVLDIATTTVPRGLVKRMADENKPIPEGWAINEHGEYVTEAKDILQVLLESKGGLVPLGGKDTMFGGHKGYGLSMMVDILTGTLSGFKNSYQIKDSKDAAGRSSQSYIVIDISFFVELEKFKKDLGNLLLSLKNAPAEKDKRVMFHGELEAENEEYQETHGILIPDTTYASLEMIAAEFKIKSVLFNR